MNIHEDLYRNGLYRPRDGRVLGGVCAGLARKLGIDPWGARVLFVVVLMLIPGSQLIVYPLLWVLMPAEPAPYPAGYGAPYGQPAYGQPAYGQPAYQQGYAQPGYAQPGYAQPPSATPQGGPSQPEA